MVALFFRLTELGYIFRKNLRGVGTFGSHIPPTLKKSLTPSRATSTLARTSLGEEDDFFPGMTFFENAVLVMFFVISL